MDGISFITNEIGRKTQIVIDLQKHKDDLKKFFRRTDTDSEGTTFLSPRKLRVTSSGALLPLDLDQELAAVHAEAEARVAQLEKKLEDMEEKLDEYEHKIDTYEDRLEEYEKEKVKEEEEAVKQGSTTVAEKGKAVAPEKPINKTDHEGPEVKPLPASIVENILKNAKALVGTPHVLGKMDTSGIDCSGLTTLAFREAGIALPRTSRTQAEVGETINEKSDLKKGDLVFFASGKPGRINHVGIVYDNSNEDNIKFIHTSTSRGVMISTLSSGFWSTAYIKGQRVLES